jgi:transcriptional regulator with XRE-family HTH domain
MRRRARPTLEDVKENRLGEFLRARRELVRPEQAGVHAFGRRRVKGLRREELATLAGVSVDYYTRLEQGRERNPSAQVVDALARVLALDADGTAHAHALARAARPHRTPARAVRPAVHQLLAGFAGPAFVYDGAMDVRAHNELAAALHPAFATGGNPVRTLFLDPAAPEFFPDWNDAARTTVAALREGANLDDPRLTELVGELSLKSEPFRRLWARHDVAAKRHGTKRMLHPLVGELDLAWEAMTLGDGLTLIAYHAQPGSRSADGLALLGSLSVLGQELEA